MIRKVITGLEGSGKSSKIFENLVKENKASKDKPILFGVKNYRLMLEQIDNWTTRYDIDKEEFNICGFNMSYEPAREAYTNPEYPSLISDKCKYVFTSQALIQRNKHLDFMNETTEKLVEYSEIIIDEFDFSSGLIPTLDYQMCNLKVERSNVEKMLLDWVRKNYTNQDYLNIIWKLNRKEKGFTLAHWIDSCRCPLTFLTSEKLSTKILESLGFVIINLDTDIDFKDCIVNIWNSDYITEEFINEMNKSMAWNRLNYDLIISDRILSYYNTTEYSLDIEVINHSSIRGSNNYRDKKILTLLTYIPKQAIIEILEALKYITKEDYSYSEIERLFYRDRLCQAIGRTLGYRGGKETDVIIHSNIYKILDKEDIPYTFKDKELLNELADKEYILEKTVEKREKRKEIQNRKKKELNVIDFSFLDNYFYVDDSSEYTVGQLKDYIVKKNINGVSGKPLPVSKILKYFSLKEKSKRLNGKLTRFVKGINII